MDPAQLIVTVGGLALVVAVIVYFFGPRRKMRPPPAGSAYGSRTDGPRSQ